MFVNTFSIQRGAICVLRYHSDGAHSRLTAFEVVPRANWKEWNGAFSML